MYQLRACPSALLVTKSLYSVCVLLPSQTCSLTNPGRADQRKPPKDAKAQVSRNRRPFLTLSFHLSISVVLQLSAWFYQSSIDPAALSLEVGRRMETHHLAGTDELTLQQALLPPAAYFLALVLLPPFETLDTRARWVVKSTDRALGLLAALLFARLPHCYHVSWSPGFNYIMGLFSWFGAARAVELFIFADAAPLRLQRKLTPMRTPLDSTKVPSVDLANPGSSLSRGLFRLSCGLPKRCTIFWREGSAPVECSRLITQNEPKPTSQAVRGLNSATTPNDEARSSAELYCEEVRPEPQRELSWAERAVYALDLGSSMRLAGWKGGPSSSWVYFNLSRTRLHHIDSSGHLVRLPPPMSS